MDLSACSLHNISVCCIRICSCQRTKTIHSVLWLRASYRVPCTVCAFVLHLVFISSIRSVYIGHVLLDYMLVSFVCSKAAFMPQPHLPKDVTSAVINKLKTD